MKKFTLFLVLSFLCPVIFMSCEEKVDLDKEKAAVSQVLEKYVTANQTKDMNLVKEIWSNDDNIVIFGTDLDEKLVGWSQIQEIIKKQYQTIDQSYISVNDQNITVSQTGKTAWFSEILEYNFIFDGKPVSYENVRFTGVVEKMGEQWKIVQSHLSIPAEKFR